LENTKKQRLTDDSKFLLIHIFTYCYGLFDYGKLILIALFPFTQDYEFVCHACEMLSVSIIF